MKSLYNEQYYQRWEYEFDSRFPYCDAMARELIGRFTPKLVLDVGCAKGYLVYAFKELGVEAYGVDISEYAISHSPEDIRRLLFKVDVEVERLPFEDQTFDLITALDLIEHLQNFAPFIDEINRVLKTRGVLLISTPRSKWADILWRPIWYGKVDFTHVNTHSKLFWIRNFESRNFHYIGDFEDSIKRALSSLSPSSKFGKLLCKFGRAGKYARNKLAILVRTIADITLLFEKPAP